MRVIIFVGEHLLSYSADRHRAAVDHHVSNVHTLWFFEIMRLIIVLQFKFLLFLRILGFHLRQHLLGRFTGVSHRWVDLHVLVSIAKIMVWMVLRLRTDASESYIRISVFSFEYVIVSFPLQSFPGCEQARPILSILEFKCFGVLMNTINRMHIRYAFLWIFMARVVLIISGLQSTVPSLLGSGLVRVLFKHNRIVLNLADELIDTLIIIVEQLRPLFWVVAVYKFLQRSRLQFLAFLFFHLLLMHESIVHNYIIYTLNLLVWNNSNIRFSSIKN